MALTQKLRDEPNGTILVTPKTAYVKITATKWKLLSDTGRNPLGCATMSMYLSMINEKGGVWWLA